MKWLDDDSQRHLANTIRQYLDHGTWAQKRNALACWIGLHGLRVGEIVTLRATDLDGCAHKIRVRTAKGGRPRTIPIAPQLTSEILKWRQGTEAKPLLHTATGRPCCPSEIQRFARKLTNEATGQPNRFHSLRHTCAMRIYGATRDIIAAQKHLGHKDLRSTAAYAHELTPTPPSAIFTL